MELDVIGKWAFLIGLVIAILAALVTNVLSASTILLILFVLGLLVGLLNIDKKNITEFLVATIALLMVGSLGALSVGALVTPIAYLESMLGNFAAFVAAAALVVSLKAIIATSKR